MEWDIRLSAVGIHRIRKTDVVQGFALGIQHGESGIYVRGSRYSNMLWNINVSGPYPRWLTVDL
jgi:hypothetical protein